MGVEFGTRYELLRPLGSGGMGEVFLVRDLAARRVCALKRLKVRARVRRSVLRREFETLTRIRHPAVVAVHDFAIAPDGTPFFTMEYVPGRPPDALLLRGDWHALLAISAEIAHGLEVLHAQGIIHGDLKPSNVLIVADDPRDGSLGSIRLVDFGLAGVLGETGVSHRGTSGFAAPEVVRGAPLDVASDLYAFGATLFTLACGRPPFAGGSAETVLRRQMSSAPDRTLLEAGGAPRSLIELVLQLLAPDPHERMQGAREVRRELEAIDPAIRRSLADRMGSATLAGRERELAAVESRLGRRLQRPRMVVLTGPAGIGKSALLAEIAARAAIAGHPVVRVSGPRLPPAEDLLRGARKDPPGSPDPARGEVDARQAQSRTERPPPQHPVYIVDDAHHLDSQSRRLVRRTLFHPESGPTLWVLAREAGSAPPEDERMLVESGLAEVLTLRPLDEEATAQLVGARLGEPPPLRLRQYLWDAGRGHPGLTVAALTLAARSGALRESEAGLVVEAGALEHLVVAETLEAEIGARARDLPETARRVLDLLAVIPSGTFEELKRIEPLLDPATLSQLRDLGLVREERGRSFRLAWPRTEEHVDPVEARRLHRAALSLPDLTPAERFRHLRGAGDTAGALQAAHDTLANVPDPALLAAAADLAVSIGASESATWHERTARALFEHSQYAEAVPHLERALAMDAAAESRAGRLYLLSSAHLRLGGTERAADAVARALKLDPPLALRSRLLTNESARLQSQGNLEAAAETAGRALESAELAADPEATGAAAQSLVYILLARGQVTDAGRMAELAARASREHGTAFSRARAEGALAAVAFAQHRHALALERYGAALDQSRARGIHGVVEELLINQSAVLSALGRWSEFRQANAEALRLALEEHRPRDAAVAMSNLAHADALTGRPRRARREARSAIRLGRRHLPALEASAWRALAHAERVSGRLDAADRAARRAVELARERASAEEIGWSQLEYGLVCAARGRLTEATAVWRSGLEELPAGLIEIACRLRAFAGEGSLHAQRLDQAAADLRKVEDLLERATVSPQAQALVLRLRAGLAISQGRHEAGVRLAAEALVMLKRIPAPAEHAATAVGLAQLALQRNAHLAPLREWLDEAASAFERLGDLRGRERALQGLVEWYRGRGDGSSGRRGSRALFEAVSELLTSLSDLRELAERAMGLVVEQLSAERGVFLVIDPESGRLTPVAERGAIDSMARRQAVGYSRRVVDRVAGSGGSLLIIDAPLDPRASSQSVQNLRLRSILCIPLSAGGRVVGAVYLDDSRRPRAFDEADQELLEGIANLLAIAIDRSLGQREIERTNELLVGENRSLRREVARHFRSQELIGNSLAFQRILPLIERAAATNTTVLVEGESGTGKELIARIIHSNGKRKLRPFVSVNCGAIPETLMESEFFGILPNVATGVRGREGLFRQADGGTLFLDEIGDMPLRQQVALLSAIANREITPVGGGRPFPVDVRIIAATNRDLRRMVGEGTFREELYYRLNVFPIEVPPLRDRKADIPALAAHFVSLFAALQEREAPDLTAEFVATLMRSQWPGNVRELQNYIERITAMTPGSVLHAKPPPPGLEHRPLARRSGSLVEQLETIERQLLQQALQRCTGNQTLAARELGIPEPGVRYRMRKYGIIGVRQKRRTDPKRRLRA